MLRSRVCQRTNSRDRAREAE
eukprot:COSAG06_NODE_64021_length_260_cov_1.596273_1_plen_20_part_10